jgi:hypothetical protein
MAVAFVSAGRATAVYSGTTITAAITRGAANYIVCFPFARDNSAINTGATYDGNAMTNIIATASDGGISLAGYGYPLTTDGNLVGSFTAINAVAQMTYALFSGVDTGSPTIDFDTAGEAGTDLDVGITGGSANDMTVVSGFLRAVSTMTAGPNTTVQNSGNEATFGSTVGIGTAGGAATTAGFDLGAAAEAFAGAILLRATGGGSAVTGTGAATSPAATASGTAVRGVNDAGGAVALTGPVATVSGTGTVSVPGLAITGTGALTSPAATIAGISVRGHVGTGALTAPAATLSGTNIPLATGGGATRDTRRRGFYIPLYGRG